MKFGRFSIPSISFLLLLMIMVAGRGFSRTITVDDEGWKRWRFEFYAPSKPNSDTISPSDHNSGEDKTSLIYGASKRPVPQGPNPLHN
ncbi:hypothetical protein QJS10_CPA09g01617 [Acorus calamus]|uniref:Uncharacterized protein n=1 Tax=Acorus calamus TaxID=4465 RepID=A0AAV9E5C1_ACOCL|nr:hypothetical protein QJS10_CPA09g01617 [Acorus calamus]